MTRAFTSSFKQQAVEKALGRSPGVTLTDLAAEFGVGNSTLQRWIRESRAYILKATQCAKTVMKKERRPQDWSKEDKLDMVISCGALDEAQVSESCREKSIYPHHNVVPLVRAGKSSAA